MTITVDNHQEQLVLGWDINFSHFSLKKDQKKRISRSGFCHCQQQKCYRNLFFRHIKPLKGYVRYPHRFIGKVKLFGLNWTPKKLPFLFRVALQKPPFPVGLMNSIICNLNQPNFLFRNIPMTTLVFNVFFHLFREVRDRDTSPSCVCIISIII